MTAMRSVAASRWRICVIVLRGRPGGYAVSAAGVALPPHERSAPFLPDSPRESAQVLVEELQRPVPGELRRRLVVARRRVVVEAVLRPLVDEQLIGLVVRLERGLIGRNARADAGVLR